MKHETKIDKGLGKELDAPEDFGRGAKVTAPRLWFNPGRQEGNTNKSKRCDLPRNFLKLRQQTRKPSKLAIIQMEWYLKGLRCPHLVPEEQLVQGR